MMLTAPTSRKPSEAIQALRSNRPSDTPVQIQQHTVGGDDCHEDANTDRHAQPPDQPLRRNLVTPHQGGNEVAFQGTVGNVDEGLRFLEQIIRAQVWPHDGLLYAWLAQAGLEHSPVPAAREARKLSQTR